MKKLMKLKKSFETESDSLRSFVSCNCPAIQCACDDIYSSVSVSKASQKGLTASRQNYSSYYNR